jgi:alanine-synthesizing transaminase
MLNFPHNPTTKTVEVSFFEEVVRFAKYHNIIVIHDFAYCDITYDNYEAPSFLQVPGAKDIGVEFITMSKSYNMAGWRIGFCVGNKEIVQALGKIKGYYDYGIFLPIQVASIVALRESDDYIKEQVKIYQNRRDILVDGLNRIGWQVEKPKATMFVWTPIPDKYRFMKSFEFAKFLMEEANVSVSPGEGFGQGKGLGRGGGRGRNNGGGFGVGGFCVCAKCKTKVPHQRGIPCTKVKCPNCGHVMVREELLAEKS